MEGEKILFLDIDGVCNFAGTKERHRGFIGIDPLLMERAKKIIEDTKCSVVLSSTWRLKGEDRQEVQRHIKLYDATPYRPGSLRGLEVKLWLEWHPAVKVYAILDDNSDFYGYQHLFKTSFTEGLTEEIAKKVIEHLNGSKP